MDRLAELRKVAEAATPGPWVAASFDDDRDRTIATVATVARWVVGPDAGSIEGMRYGYDQHAGEAHDAAHIAAFDPPTVLLMLDALEKARTYFNGYAQDEADDGEHIGDGDRGENTGCSRQQALDALALRAALAGLESIRGRGEGK